jgi:hypothetical protein
MALTSAAWSGRGNTLTGTVTEPEGRPVAGAIVTVAAGAGSQPWQTEVCDDAGRFVFRDLPSQALRVTARKSGYVGGQYGQRFPVDVPVPLRLSAEEHLPIHVTLWKTAAVAGRVTDGKEPLTGQRVSALKELIIAGYRSLKSIRSTTTDDRGLYRLIDLMPGRYVIAVEASRPLGSSGSNSEFPAVFHPGVSRASEAAQYDLESGDERLGLDFQRSALPVFRVSGLVNGASDVGGTEISATPADVAEPLASLDTATAIADRDGVFRFDGLPAGRYVLTASRWPSPIRPEPGAAVVLQSGAGSSGSGPLGRGLPLAAIAGEPTLWGRVEVSITEPASGITIAVASAPRISGRVVFDDVGQKPSPSQLAATPVFMIRADGRDIGRFQVPGIEADGTFRTAALPPGPYIPFVRSSIGLLMRTVLVSGVAAAGDVITIDAADVSDVEIHMSSLVGVLDGTARDKDGAGVSAASVFVFPTDPRLWRNTGVFASRLFQTRTDRAGAYSIQGLVPGEYYLAALESLTPENWMDPEFLARLAPLATRFAIDGGRQRLDLRLQSLRR